jgi:hypothetical protein
MSLVFSRDFWKCPSFLETYYENPRWEGVEWIHLAQYRVLMCASMMQKMLIKYEEIKELNFSHGKINKSN